jgi:hypothetical protein
MVRELKAPDSAKGDGFALLNPSYSLAAVRYLALNPVVAEYEPRPGLAWSSARADLAG